MGLGDMKKSSISKQDIESLGITKEEMQFVNEYIDSLNIGVHEKD